jgi:hypothetical protein
MGLKMNARDHSGFALALFPHVEGEFAPFVRSHLQRDATRRHVFKLAADHREVMRTAAHSGFRGADMDGPLGRRRSYIAAGVLASLWLVAAGSVRSEQFNGFNLIMAPNHPFGTASTQEALARAKRAGATAVAIVPFLWQPSPSSPEVVRGADLSDELLRAAIHQARNAGLAVIVKPHVWVPQSWAGAVAPISEADWTAWFAGYRRAIERLGRIAGEERADAFAIGTELEKTTHRPEWLPLIAAVRRVFSGTLTYFAHNTEEAEQIQFWSRLDAIGVTLYPALGPDRDRPGRLAKMREAADKLDAIAAAAGKSVLVGEIGLRSAVGAAARPWESAEERQSAPDPLLQAEVIADWLSVLDRPAVRGVLIWRWFTDPEAGGPADTDFTVQRKPAEGVLLCVWRLRCGPR